MELGARVCTDLYPSLRVCYDEVDVNNGRSRSGAHSGMTGGLTDTSEHGRSGIDRRHSGGGANNNSMKLVAW